MLVDPDTISFELERYELVDDKRLEVGGRWYGVRGRRFVRPTLTVLANGESYRLLAVLDHKPWAASEGKPWIAAFPLEQDPADLADAELAVAHDIAVPLPPRVVARSGERVPEKTTAQSPKTKPPRSTRLAAVDGRGDRAVAARRSSRSPPDPGI